MAKTEPATESRTRTRLLFPKSRLIPGCMGHQDYVEGFVEGAFLFPDSAACRARNVRVHVASLAVLEDLPNPTK